MDCAACDTDVSEPIWFGTCGHGVCGACAPAVVESKACPMCACRTRFIEQARAVLALSFSDADVADAAKISTALMRMHDERRAVDAIWRSSSCPAGEYWALVRTICVSAPHIVVVAAVAVTLLTYVLVVCDRIAIAWFACHTCMRL